MFWSFSIGQVAGTTVRVHVTFILLLAWIGLDSYFEGGLGAASRTLIFVVAVFGCIVAHEFGHVLVARRFGVTTPDITLYPFGGIARLNTIPQVPLQEFLIAIAGPAVNFAIAGGLLTFAGADLTVAVLSHAETDFASRLAATNLALAVFNLIPAFPMDGGRVLRAALCARFGFERATRLAATVGHWVAVGFAIAGLFVNPMLIVIALFVFFAATAELQATAVRAFSKELPVTRAMISEFSTLPAQATVADAVERFLHTSQKVIPVIGDAGRFVGVLEIGDVTRALYAQSNAPQLAVDIMVSNIPMLPLEAKLDEAFRLLQEKSAPAVAIVDENERLSGLITLETLGEMLMLHDASASVFEGLHERRGKRGAGQIVDREANARSVASVS